MASDSSVASHVASSVSQSVRNAMESQGSTVSSAMSSATAAVTAQEPSSWLGSFAWLILALLNLVSTILYRVIRIATITLPAFLFTLLSTSWTVTMNATTLYVDTLRLVWHMS